MGVADGYSRLAICILVGVFPSVGLLRAQSPPGGAADLFVPSIPGLVATDFCVGATDCNFDPYQGWRPGGGPELNVDALGMIYPPVPIGGRQIGTCTFSPTRIEPIMESIVGRLLPSGSTEEVGVFRSRCNPPEYTRVSSFQGRGLDTINGVLYVSMTVSNDSGTTYAVVKITGLPTLLDIILSYQPPSTLAFNVPVRPEGLSGADSFSLYAGDVRTAADLSQAVPLQCVVPAGRAPVPGDLLTVPDTLPDPAAGEGRYYLAAVNHQGQRRAGRSSINGEIQGRNAVALPVCQ